MSLVDPDENKDDFLVSLGGLDFRPPLLRQASAISKYSI